MDKYNIVAIMGESGSGKDSILKEVLKRTNGYNEIISYTSRPMREGEEDGVNYHFISSSNFLVKDYRNQFLETSNFNGWLYGTAIDSLKKDKINIGVFNPTGIRNLLKNDNVNVFVIYISVDDKKRLLRQLNREEHPNVKEIVRRFSADEEDFKNLNFKYFTLINDTISDFEECVDYISRIPLRQGRNRAIFNN